ncbi:hypothetical protein PAT3040_04080 [Paenibacillus agaridevorans]|uniref:SGNH hydrolase-type esterase domain-containing protein n=1 Tax=Paenibacillus agaridevorans TaxID=171404 RepID=A0A2R5F161_9BACL|nr:SGNH/GDSL hydrolase family protein [Paenibacillus agaridevorans]GBG09434.1 hypothetical protein PAT3040_04080 [Paenibacillus agaridevorans]
MLNKMHKGESVVFVGQTPQKLRHGNVVRCLSVGTGQGSDHPKDVTYMEQEDFVIDYEAGTIARTENSSIPDWRSHVVYGKESFDHRDYADCSNRKFTVYVDYEYIEESEEAHADCADAEGEQLRRVRAKIAAGENIRYVVFGDSISAGGDASRDEYAFYQLFAGELRKRFEGMEFEMVNRAIGGETSVDGLKRFEDDVIALRPDIVSIGYGMNDQCTMSEQIRNGVPPGEFERNIRQMVTRIQEATGADIILVTPCESNPQWKHSSGDLAIYADILKRIGKECNIAVADVHRLWNEELRAGKTHESLLLNNINHPNDYGHRIYYEAFVPLIPAVPSKSR